MSVEKAIATIESREQDAIKRLTEWLSIPSVSTDSDYRDDCRAAAAWCVERLREAGVDAELRETGTPDKPGHPIVWAEHAGPSDYKGPHVLFYGHYDVQPPDPLALWESPPFEPVIKAADGEGLDVPGERIVARGAVDDKGQVAAFLEALRAWHEVKGEIPIRLTVMIEGEEESGSVNLERFVEAHKSELERADICVISDTGMLGRGKPAITSGVRGLAYTEITLHGPNQDLHSGAWGGRVPNPLNELVKVLSSLWDADRKVTIPGFYEDVLEPTAEERKEWASLGFDQVGALKKVGLGPAADIGEAGYSALEREWARPTAEINGVWGGYTGKGAKTVIPSHASAKVSFRLVANQNPDSIVKAFRSWLDEHTPPGCCWDFQDHGGGWPGNVSTESPYLEAAREAIAAAADVDHAALIKTGGSIPVVGLLKKSLGLDTLLVGFGLDDDRVHSPNEKFELECFRIGMRTHVRLMERFSGMG